MNFICAIAVCRNDNDVEAVLLPVEAEEEAEAKLIAASWANIMYPESEGWSNEYSVAACEVSKFLQLQPTSMLMLKGNSCK